MEQEHHSNVMYSCMMKMVKLSITILVTWNWNKEKRKTTVFTHTCIRPWVSGSALSGTTENMQRDQQQRQKICLLLWYMLINFGLFLIMWQKLMTKNLLPHSVCHYWMTDLLLRAAILLVWFNYLMDLRRVEWVGRKVITWEPKCWLLKYLFPHCIGRRKLENKACETKGMMKK